MTLDLRPILRGETNCIPIDYTLVPEKISGVDFGDAVVTGRVTDTGGYIRLELSAEVEYSSECARCLQPISGRFKIDFERTVSDERTLSREAIEENDGEYAIMTDGRLNVDEELLEELVLMFPMKLLCSEDCEGLCSKCGKPRREGACSCSEKEIDPRLAVLKSFFEEDGGEDK